MVTRVAAASFDLDYRIIDPLSVGNTTYAAARTGLAAFDLAAEAAAPPRPRGESRAAFSPGRTAGLQVGGR